MNARVYLRGRGALSAFGDWPATWQALAEGRSAIAPITRFDASGFPCGVAAVVGEGTGHRGHRQNTENTEEKLLRPLRDSVSSVTSIPIMDRRLALALAAAEDCLADADGAPEARSLGIFVGAESGRADFASVLALARAAGGGRVFDAEAFGRSAPALASVLEASAVSPATVASVLAARTGAQGPALTLSMACASGAMAIAEGARAIQRGEIRWALCGGVGADVDPLMLAGFGHLGALSAAGRSRPFDVHRDGFVVGEGAAFLLLSSEPGALGVELTGLGRSLDGHHLTAPDPEGDGMARAIEAALGGQAPDLIQAHGTSTPLNDAVEAKALARVLGPSLARIPVSSAKGALGHWIAGAGALGALCAAESLLQGLALPTTGLQHPDPEPALDHVLHRARPGNYRSALANAFAFGGANCSLLFRRTV